MICIQQIFTRLCYEELYATPIKQDKQNDRTNISLLRFIFIFIGKGPFYTKFVKALGNRSLKF
jgi:hypothetical protein